MPPQSPFTTNMPVVPGVFPGALSMCNATGFMVEIQLLLPGMNGLGFWNDGSRSWNIPKGKVTFT